MNIRWGTWTIMAAGLLAGGAEPAGASIITAQPLPVTAYGCYEASSGGLESGEFTFFSTPTKWAPGSNSAELWTVASPGGATWSIMGPNFVDGSGKDDKHGSELTKTITELGVAGWSEDDYIAMIDDALNVWAAVSGFTNLGMVPDGGVQPGAPDGAGGHLGDIRIGAWEYTTNDDVLAHAWQPATEANLMGGSIGGDVHIDVNRIWVDDPTDDTSDNDFDLFTVVLHELGHSLGLGHSLDVNAVMYANYMGARRSLHADDIVGIQALYGPAQSTPEPSSLLLLGTLGLGAAWRRRRRSGEHAAELSASDLTS